MDTKKIAFKALGLTVPEGRFGLCWGEQARVIGLLLTPILKRCCSFFRCEVFVDCIGPVVRCVVDRDRHFAEETSPSDLMHKRGGGRTAPSLIAIGLMILPTILWADLLPTGGKITSGSATISQSHDDMTIHQSTDRMVADWKSFSIGKNNSVTFNQPSQSAMALNRVLGSEVSLIQGRLNANGQVFLVNPAGVLFSESAQVNVGGIVASTLEVSKEDFLAGRHTFAGPSEGSIVNQGTISAADGGYVALIAARIENSGTLTANEGGVLLGAGSRVTLDLGGPVKLEVDEAVLDALIKQSGAIRADGGWVYLTAKAAGDLASTVINQTGIIEARTLVKGENGEIKLLGDMTNDRIQVDGKLDASAPYSGNGGFVETSAADVRIQEGLQVTTKAIHGKTGTWLIDPADYTIAASGGNITGSTLSSNLEDNDVEIVTTDRGDILVNDPVTWHSDATLTLDADDDIEVNRDITATGDGAGLVLDYRDEFDLQDGAVITLSGSAPSLAISGHDYTVINDAESLQHMAENLEEYYALGSDIDAAETSRWHEGDGFIPVGDDDDPFEGTFNGLGHTIKDLMIDRPRTDFAGAIRVH